MHAQFKLSAGSPRRDKQDPVEIFVIVGLSGAYQARNASQMPSIRVVFDATKVEKQLPTRTVKSDDALTKNNLVACFSNRPIFCARSQSATSALFNTRLLGSSVDFVDSPLWSVVEETVDPHMPIFLYEKSFFGPAGFSTAKNSQKGPPTHLGLLPLLQQCSGNGISTATARGAPYGHFFTKKNFFRPSLIFHRQEQPKRRPKPPGLASIATAVLWQQYFNCHNRGRIERN